MAAPVFNPKNIAIFDKAGNGLGPIQGWAINQPRSFRLNEVEDFAFTLPRNDMVTGDVILTDHVVGLLRRDNLVYLQNRTISMRGWAGAIRDVVFADGMAYVSCTGLAGLLHGVNSALIEQDDGFAWTIARRFVLAAQAKQAAHGDFVLDFIHDETPGNERRNYGHYAADGDILSNLQQVAGQTLSEFFVHSRIDIRGNLRAAIRWGGRYNISKTGIIIKDGLGGNILPGNQLAFTSGNLVNSVVLHGTPTDLSKFLDYGSIEAFVRDVTPTAELSLDSVADPNHRLREDTTLSVGFGYSAYTEAAMASQLQERYLGYFKSWIYAYHQRLGKPFLDGYDWTGPDGTNDKQLTSVYFRSYSQLGFIGKRTVVVGTATDDDLTQLDATLEDWQFVETISPVSTCVGIAIDWSSTDQKYVADGDTGIVWVLEEDLVTKSQWQGVTSAGETLAGIATDATAPTLLWVLVTDSTTARVKCYNANTKALVSVWTQTIPNANDISVNVSRGIVWLVAADGASEVQALDINSGVELSGTEFVTFDTDIPFPKGISVTGDLAYVIDGAGYIKFYYTKDGALAGSKHTGIGANGVFSDAINGRMWVCRLADGNVNVYSAHVAVGAIDAPGGPDGAAGFERISVGQFVHVVLNSDKAKPPHSTSKLGIVYAKGKYVTRTVSGLVGEPDVIQRTWVTGENQFAIVPRKSVIVTTPEQIIQGEEARVDDWDPKRDGYGKYEASLYRTGRGHIIRYEPGWVFHDWDVPDTTWDVTPPEWTEGLAYLQSYLSRTNTERPVQVLRVNNRGNLFSKLVLGGKYTIRITLQGPPAGFTGVLRVLSYTPDESQGICEIIGEWV